MQRTRRVLGIALLLGGMTVSIGCGSGRTSGSTTAARKGDPPISTAPARDKNAPRTVAEIQADLKAKNRGYADGGEFRKVGGEVRYAILFQAGLNDVSPLEGLPLKQLDLTGNNVTDLSALKGMPLEELYLENTTVTDLMPLAGMPLSILRAEHTPVEDISPLAGMKLTQLNLFDTKVTSIEAIKGMPLNTLWLQKTAVSNLTPLQGMSLQSLDIKETPVEDISVLAEMRSLKRLNIADAAVADLSALKGLSLERLIFTPKKIQAGLEAVREMTSIQAIGTSFDTVTPPAQFWVQYDSGAFE